MAEKLVLLSKSAGAPKIDVLIGQAQFGTYEIMLWNDTKREWDVVGRGANFDDVTDEFPLGALGKLDNRFLRWDLIISAPAVGDTYKARIKITQGNDVVPGGFHQYEGEVKPNPKILIDMVKLVVR